jgi:hypothetical protein
MKNQQLENCRESAGTQATNIENPRVGGSIPPQATNKINDLAQPTRQGFVGSGVLSADMQPQASADCGGTATRRASRVGATRIAASLR